MKQKLFFTGIGGRARHLLGEIFRVAARWPRVFDGSPDSFPREPRRRRENDEKKEEDDEEEDEEDDEEGDEEEE